MDLPHIKPMHPSSTGPQFKNLDRVARIEKHLAGSKSSLGDLKSLSNSDRGLYCEFLVYKKFINMKMKFMGHQLKTAFGEVDLLFFDPLQNLATLIEVKSCTSDDFLVSRVSLRQKSKLKACRLFFERDFSEVQILLALVSHDASIELIESFLS